MLQLERQLNALQTVAVKIFQLVLHKPAVWIVELYEHFLQFLAKFQIVTAHLALPPLKRVVNSCG